MATIRPTFDLETALTVSGLSSLSDGATAESVAVDNNTTPSLNVEIEIKLTGTVTTSVDSVDVYMIRSMDGTDYSTYAAEEGKVNLLFLSSVALNTSTSVTKSIRVEQLPPYWKLLFDNQSGGAISAESISYRTSNLTNG